MRIFIVRHLDESFFSAGITPQGFYDQHSPLTLFRKVEVLTIICSIALQRQVFVIHFRGGQYFLQLRLGCVAVEATLATMEMTIHAQDPYTNFFFDAITPTLHSNWMLWLSIRSSLKLGAWSVQHCQTNSVVERSSDGQVVLNRHREGHFVLFEANRLFVCAFLIVF